MSIPQSIANSSLIFHSVPWSAWCTIQARDSILELAKLFTGKTNRAMIVATTCYNRMHVHEKLCGCQLHPFESVRMNKVAKELLILLEGIETSTQSASPQQMVQLVMNVLTHSDLHPKSSKRTATKQVFIVSTSPGRFIKGWTRVAPLQVHLICPGIPPSDLGDLCNNSEITSVLNVWPHSSEPSGDRMSAFSAKLREIVTLAGTSPDRIEDVILELRPGPGCTVMNVLGQNRQSLLRPEQVMTLLVKVKIPAIRRRKTPKLESNKRSSLSLRYEEALADLETALGETVTEALTVTARHKHPRLPRNSQIVVEEICRIRRSNQSSAWSVTEDPRMAAQLHEQVQQRLAFCIATECEPKPALQMLKETFNAEKWPVERQSSVEFIMKEVEYQICVQEGLCRRAGHQDDDGEDGSPDLGRFSFENRPSEVLNLQESPLALRSASDSPATVIYNRSSEKARASSESIDQARKIWHVMRKDSRSSRPLQHNSMESLHRLESSDEQLRQIRKQALRNKRSVGADTLRSIAIVGKGGAGGGAIPWL